MARARDYAAEYRARKLRLAAEGTTLYRRRNTEARRLGYDSLADQRKRRRAGEITHADHAERAKREGGSYVDNLGRGRWTFKTPDRDPNSIGDYPLDRRRLQQTLDRAWRADVNATMTASWRHPNGRTGTAQAGGSYGVRVRGFHDEGADALDSVESELGASTGSELPPGAYLTSLSMFLFPAQARRAA